MSLLTGLLTMGLGGSTNMPRLRCSDFRWATDGSTRNVNSVNRGEPHKFAVGINML